MSVQNIVLYGPRLYGSSTYSTNEDPESLSLNLTDTANIADAQFQFLQDALVLLESAITTDGIKALAESLSMTESMFLNAVRNFSDSLLLQDAILLQQIKGLSDFIIVKDWLDLKLDRANIWQSTPAYGFRPSNIHLYGPGVYYGFDFYAANPTVNWLLSTPNATTWSDNSQGATETPLYADVLYSQTTFGAIPAVGWTRPTSTTQRTWTNNNGESHN